MIQGCCFMRERRGGGGGGGGNWNRDHLHQIIIYVDDSMSSRWYYWLVMAYHISCKCYEK